MAIGVLGDVVFEANPARVLTPRDVSWSGSARFSEHKRHAGNALTEFTGIDADKMSLSITLSSDLGIDPQAELSKIWAHERNGDALRLVIGAKAYGKYRWTITSHKTQMRHFDREGNLIAADVSISLLEYVRF
jgi:phage protein U